MDFSQVGTKIEQFFADGDVTTHMSGQVFTDFETQPDLMMITEGYIKLTTYTTTRQERIQYIAGPGDGVPMHNLFAEMPMQTYPLYALAFTDVTVRSKKRQDFLAFIEADPKVIIAILQGIMQAAFNRLYNLNLETPEQKVAHILILYAERLGIEKDSIFTKLAGHMTTHVVASSVYLSKTITAEILQDFEEKQYVIVKSESLYVAVDKLKDVAGIRPHHVPTASAALV